MSRHWFGAARFSGLLALLVGCQGLGEGAEGEWAPGVGGGAAASGGTAGGVGGAPWSSAGTSSYQPNGCGSAKTPLELRGEGFGDYEGVFVHGHSMGTQLWCQASGSVRIEGGSFHLEFEGGDPASLDWVCFDFDEDRLCGPGEPLWNHTLSGDGFVTPVDFVGTVLSVIGKTRDEYPFMAAHVADCPSAEIQSTGPDACRFFQTDVASEGFELEVSVPMQPVTASVHVWFGASELGPVAGDPAFYGVPEPNPESGPRPPCVTYAKTLLCSLSADDFAAFE